MSKTGTPRSILVSHLLSGGGGGLASHLARTSPHCRIFSLLHSKDEPALQGKSAEQSEENRTQTQNSYQISGKCPSIAGFRALAYGFNCLVAFLV